MWFAIFGQDVNNSLEMRKQLRPAHLERIKQLNEQGRVLLAGPHPIVEGEGFSGSLMVVDFDSFEQAQEWAESDPYAMGGVFEKVTVKPFTKVLP